VKYQSPTYAGLKSFYDFNLLKLLKYPVLSDHTRRSYPLMLYGSFWYQYLPESNFKANLTPAGYLGSVIYLFALLPTLLLLIGFLKIVYSLKKLSIIWAQDKTFHGTVFYEAVSLFLLLSNLFVIIFLAFKYDVYSVFQGRFLFPSFFSFIILLNAGLSYVQENHPAWQKIIYPLLSCLYLLFILYFGIEIYMKIV
jgi:hypothetical protein